MDQPPALAFTAIANVWPRATETEIGAALCAIGAGRTLTLILIPPPKSVKVRHCSFHFMVGSIP